jgi:hypothetical protein
MRADGQPGADLQAGWAAGPRLAADPGSAKPLDRFLTKATGHLAITGRGA